MSNFRDGFRASEDVQRVFASYTNAAGLYVRRETGKSIPETFANVFLPPSSIRSAPTLFTTTVQTAVADIPTTGLF